MLFIDVDHFKAVNDSLGHAAGDALLRHTADQIAEAVRPGDTAARFGGDEFVVVCDGVGSREIDRIAERILKAVRAPCMIAEKAVNGTVSIGIVLADDHATPESLLRDSDAAVSRAKERGRDRSELFDHSLRMRTEGRAATESELRRALDREEFTVYYQPVVNLVTGAMVSAEASASRSTTSEPATPRSATSSGSRSTPSRWTAPLWTASAPIPTTPPSWPPSSPWPTPWRSR